MEGQLSYLKKRRGLPTRQLGTACPKRPGKRVNCRAVRIRSYCQDKIFFCAEEHNQRNRAISGGVKHEKRVRFLKSRTGKIFRPGVTLNIPIYLEADNMDLLKNLPTKMCSDDVGVVKG
jgi:hypothetical protein